MIEATRIYEKVSSKYLADADISAVKERGPISVTYLAKSLKLFSKEAENKCKLCTCLGLINAAQSRGGNHTQRQITAVVSIGAVLRDKIQVVSANADLMLR